MSGRREERRSSVTYVLGTLVPCFLIISSLSAFTILSGRYLYVATPLQQNAPQWINTSTITARQVACAIPRSDQYCIYQRCIYYGLLVATIILTVVFKEDHGLWLASGAAATAMLYSGVAGVHQMLIFGFGLRTQEHSTCKYYLIPGTNIKLPVCSGFDDQDRDAACMIVGAGLLAVLPMAVWSRVFRKAAARPILVFWMLLMASSHVFCAVSKTETTVHYQICPAEQVEDLPGLTYVASELTETWWTKLSETGLNKSNSKPLNVMGNCLISCFAPHGYPLTAGRTIAVLDNTKPALSQTPSLRSRRLGVAFWAIYLVFSVVALLDLQGPKFFRRHPGFWRPFNFVLGPLHRQFPWMKEKINTGAARREFRKNNPKRVTCARVLIHVAIHFPRFLSAIMFIGYIVFLEWTHLDAPESEPFAAVGQFGAVVVVLLVAFGALFSRVAEQRSKQRGKRESACDKGDVELRGG
jgi:hypothetical protein